MIFIFDNNIGDDVWKGQDVTQRKPDPPRDPDEEDSDEENESLDEKVTFFCAHIE